MQFIIIFKKQNKICIWQKQKDNDELHTYHWLFFFLVYLYHYKKDDDKHATCIISPTSTACYLVTIWIYLVCISSLYLCARTHVVVKFSCCVNHRKIVVSLFFWYLVLHPLILLCEKGIWFVTFF
jgi:hypothetical protein